MTPKKTPKTKKAPAKKAPAKKARAKKPVTPTIPKKEDLPIPSKGDKTAREWFAELPDGIREAAIENAEKKGWSVDYTYESMSAAIGMSFAWRKTTQGFDYWNALYDLYIGIEEEQEMMDKREAEPIPVMDHSAAFSNDSEDISKRIKHLEWLCDSHSSRIEDLEMRLAIKEDDIEKPKRRGFWAWLWF